MRWLCFSDTGSCPLDLMENLYRMSGKTQSSRSNNMKYEAENNSLLFVLEMLF